MRETINWNSEKFRFYLFFSVIVGFGIYLRLDQFFQQVLLDDEWHAIHQLLQKSPAEIFFSFGHSDFSIPLTLFYWLELKTFGLSEFGMRWPLLLAGIASLALFPLYTRQFFGDKVTLVFSFLLAVSPLLVIYSRTARPYALTLLLSMIALAGFYRFIAADRFSWKSALVYGISAIASVWLHLISIVFISAPFIVHLIPSLLNKEWREVRYLIYLGAGTLLGILVLVLPPLLAHPQALEVKLGTNTASLDTIYGAGFAWFGVSQTWLLVVMCILFALGLLRLWNSMPLVKSLVVALIIGFLIIQITQPAWVQHPLTFARYLLVAVPLLLLGSAVGFIWVCDQLITRWRKAGRAVSAGLMMLGLGSTIVFSPLSELMAVPNSNSLHIVYQLDFRNTENKVDAYLQKNFPLSPFWKQLSSQPTDSLKIAVAPFYFESYNWDAVRWQLESQQRVMPGFVSGFCTDSRWGEVPADRGFELENAAYLGDLKDLTAKGFDMVIYQKPNTFISELGLTELGKDTSVCRLQLDAKLPVPVYEDNWLVAYPLTNQVRVKINAKR